MGIKKDLSGKRFGRLIVLREGKPRVEPKRSRVTWDCICDCGNTTTVDTGSLNNGKIISCGCYHKEQITKHGLRYHPLYIVLTGIKSRCFNPKSPAFECYGARGIGLCDEWNNNVKSFIEWGMANGYKEGLQIDRINNDGNYEPINCHFVMSRENALNRRNLIKSNTSGYCGIHYIKQEKSWKAVITVKNKVLSLGQNKDKRTALSFRNNYIIVNKLQKDYEVQQWKG